MNYIGLAFSLSMLQEDCKLDVKNISVEKVEDYLYWKPISCCNPSHSATLQALKEKFGLQVEVPTTPPRVTLTKGDCILVLQVSGLPRLTDRHEYTSEEVDKAKFNFQMVTVMS